MILLTLLDNHHPDQTVLVLPPSRDANAQRAYADRKHNVISAQEQREQRKSPIFGISKYEITRYTPKTSETNNKTLKEFLKGRLCRHIHCPGADQPHDWAGKGVSKTHVCLYPLNTPITPYRASTEHSPCSQSFRGKHAAKTLPGTKRL